MTNEIKMNLMYVHNIIANHLIGRAKSLIKNETFIAGGAIRSLYNGDKINDYDLYFYDEKSALEFKQIILNGLNNQEPFSNVDEMRLNFRASTNNAFTFYIEDLNTQVQFITKFSGQPNDVVNKFDFTNSMAFYQPQTNNLVLKEEFLDANNSKTLIFNNQSYTPASSFNRMLKFNKDGWVIPRVTALSIIETIANLPPDEKEKFSMGHSFYS
jgi:hypothetical protein